MTDMPTDQTIAEEATRASGSSFFIAMRLLPPEKRAAMYAVYAFCRDVDDIADEPGELEDKKAALMAWRGWIEDLYQGRVPGHPVARALREPIAEFHLKQTDFLAVIEGMELDARPDIRIANREALIDYCDKVACAVGRLSVRVFGMAEADGLSLARAEGLALQLTNILRDVAEDADIDRIYLPQDMLRERGLTATSPMEMLRDLSVEPVCRELSDLAVEHFAEAQIILDRSDRRATRPARIMLAVYREIHRRLVRRGWQPDVIGQSVGPGKLGKLWIAVRSGYL